MSRLIAKLFLGCAVVAAFALFLTLSCAHAQMIDKKSGRVETKADLDAAISKWKAEMVEGKARAQSYRENQTKRPLFAAIFVCQTRMGIYQWGYSYNVPSERDALDMAAHAFDSAGRECAGTPEYQVMDQWTGLMVKTNQGEIAAAKRDAVAKQRAGVGGVMMGK